MQIREADKNDIPSLVDLLLTVHAMHVRAHPDVYREVSPAEAVDLLGTRMEEPGTTVLVAVEQDGICGYCTATLRSVPEMPLLKPSHFLYLNEIAVAPQRRRSGIGRALLREAATVARKLGATRLELDVGTFNEAAAEFFRAAGFESQRTRMAYPVALA